MRFARIVFVGAGLWGIAVLTPLYWLVDITGRRYLAPADYPHFFYAFFSVAMAWQIAFLIIGSNPMRFRPLMLPSVLEKLGHVITLAVLYGQSRISAIDAQAGIPDLVLGALFISALVRTRPPRITVEALNLPLVTRSATPRLDRQSLLSAWGSGTRRGRRW
jgi:hypothetical protein